MITVKRYSILYLTKDYEINILKGLYHDGIVEMIENPKEKDASEVYVIFPEKKEKIIKLRGLIKDQKIDYEPIEKDLKRLTKNEKTQDIS